MKKKGKRTKKEARSTARAIGQALDTPEATAGSLALISSIRREITRRAIVQDGRIDVLATRILDYKVQPFHQKMIDYQSAAEDTCLQLAPRGFGKSTLLTIVRSIYEVLRDPEIRILIVSKTQNRAEGFLREIKLHLEHNPKLIEHFGRFHSDRKWDSGEIWVGPRVSLAKEATITCVGVEGPVASRHYDLIIADDLVDEENARTEGQRERVRTWFYRTLLPCLEPHGRMFIVGTRYHFMDLYGHLIENEFAGKHQIIRALGPDGSTPWPEMFSIEKLEELRRRMGTAIFNTQYQNDINEMKGAIFKEEWIKFFEEVPPMGRFDLYIGCDPAATREEALLRGGRVDTDYWAIVVGGRERNLRGEYYGPVHIFHVWRGRVTKQAYVDLLIALNKRFRPEQVLVESTGAQEYLVQDLREHMPVKGVTRTKDKFARAYWLQGHFENGQILFPSQELASNWEPYQALINELLLFPEGGHDDLFDALETMMEGAMELHPGGRFSYGVLSSTRRGPWESALR